jgi:uncharacterized damage-inducible protein DinB
MQTYFADYFGLLQNCHDDIHKALTGLPPEALDWTPGKDMNSISVLVVHLTGAERFWIGDVAAQEPSDRNRDAEFEVKGLGADTLKKRLDDTLSYVSVTLEKFSLQDLEIPRRSPRTDREFTVGWSLLHALEHSTLHLGQIQLTRQLWEQMTNSRQV